MIRPPSWSRWGSAGTPDPGSDLVAGHTEAGGTLDFGPAFCHRLALYDLYLSVLLVTECGPRGFGSGHLAFCRGRLTGLPRRAARPWVGGVTGTSS